jgi:hypothetical protein
VSESPKSTMTRFVLSEVRILRLLDGTKWPPVATKLASAKGGSEEGNKTDVSCSINSTTHCNNLFHSEKRLGVLGRCQSTIRERPNGDNGDRIGFVLP